MEWTKLMEPDALTERFPWLEAAADPDMDKVWHWRERGRERSWIKFLT